MAKTFSQIRRGLKEVQGPDPKPAIPMGPNGHSNVVREEDEVDEAYRPVKPPVVGKSSLGTMERRTGAQKAMGNQNRAQGKSYNASIPKIAEEALEKVKEKMKQNSNGGTSTGSHAETVDIEPSNQSLTGYH